MRLLIAFAFACAMLGLASDGQARFGGERSGAWCLFDNPYTYNCGFATLEQCRVTASGAGGQCQPNPSGPPAASPTRRPKRSVRER